MPTRLKLKIIKGDKRGACFDFAQDDNYLIGRNPDCHVSLADDHFASRHNSVLRLKPTYISIRDLNSRNGTYVNGQKYGGRNGEGLTTTFCLSKHPEVILNDGDHIRIGRTLFEVKILTRLHCRDCDVEVSGADFYMSMDGAMSVICTSCYQKTEEAVATAAPAGPRRCQKCGKFLAQLHNPAERKDYLCRTCWVETAESSLKFMRRVMKGITRHRPGSPAPVISAYEIERELGPSGFGAVYLARRKADDVKVAIKIMKAAAANHKRKQKKTRRENFKNYYLRRPETLELVDRGEEGVMFFFIMELCEAESVDNLIMRTAQPAVMTSC